MKSDLFFHYTSLSLKRWFPDQLHGHTACSNILEVGCSSHTHSCQIIPSGGEAQHLCWSSHPASSGAHSSLKITGLVRRPANIFFPLKDKLLNTFIFESHTISNVASQHCCCSMKIVVDSTLMSDHNGTLIKPSSGTPSFAFQIIFMCHEMLFLIIIFTALKPCKKHSWKCACFFQSCLILCEPKICNLAGISIYGILQARILKWVAMPSSRWSSRPRDHTCISCIAGFSLSTELPGKPEKYS